MKGFNVILHGIQPLLFFFMF